MSGPLISVPELHQDLGDIALFDIRWSLTDPAVGRATYLAGHIPTAAFVDLERDLSGSEGPGRHPLPTPADFAATLGRLGVGWRSDVVAYDDVGGSLAARLWWMLAAIGHRGTVDVLDGGWQAWHESGFPIETAEMATATVSYPVPPHGFRGVADRRVVAESRSHILLDARSPQRYRGQIEPVDARPGHIPGAINVPWQTNLAPDGRILDASALRRRYTDLGAERRPVIVSCGSGVTSCHLALALELAGLPRPLMYEGSFSDWAGSDLPVVQGADPG